MFVWRNKPYRNVVLLCAGLAWFPLAMPSSFRIDETLHPVFAAFPYQLDGWRGMDEPVDERTYEILETRNVLSRVYTHPEKGSVQLLLVSSQHDRRVAHPPEVCYLGSNYTITQETEARVPTAGGPVDVREFVAVPERRDGRTQQVLYVYKVGNVFTTNYFAQQLRFALDRMTRRTSEVMLIRLAGTDRRAFPGLLQQVIRHLSGEVPEEGE